MRTTLNCRTAAPFLAGLSLVIAGCEPDFDTRRQVEAYGTFGDVVCREACQRVAYLGQREQFDRGEIQTVDVAGGLGKSVCIAGAQPPENAPERLKEMPNIKASLVATVDAILPQPL